MLIRLAALTAAMLLTTAAHAETVDLIAPVAGHPDRTYADLVGQFVEGFALDPSDAGTANITTAIRYADEAEAIPEGSEIPGAVKVIDLEATTIRSGGKPVLTLSVSLDTAEGGWPIVIIGAFDADLKIIDHARVDLDRFVSLDLLPISPEDDGIVVRSSHFNAGENFESTQLVYFSQGRLTALPPIDGHTIMLCEYENVATTGYAAAGDNQPGFWPIVATLGIVHAVNQECLDEQAAADAEESDPAPRAPVEPSSTHSATRTYSWSASLGFYVETSDEITALAARYAPAE